MINYSESSIIIMTWRCKMLGYILSKLGASKVNCSQKEELRLKTVYKTQQHVFGNIGQM